MEEKLKNNIIMLTIGIRFNRSYRISDISGEIVDFILNNKKTPLWKDLKNKEVGETYGGEKIIIDRITKEFLRINTDDIIFSIKINNNFPEKFNWLTNTAMPIFEEIFTQFKITNIKRLGIIFSHKVSNKKPLNEIISSLTDTKIKDSTGITISFQKKGKTNKGVMQDGICDYTNAIYNIQESSDHVQVDLDYQYYFEPEEEYFEDCKISSFLTGAKKFLENDFYSWLKKYEETK
jgi:hypothetical protein